MRMLRMACMAFASVLLLGVLCVPANAAETEDATPETFAVDIGK